uniref:Uncharacterized protein n=1 Tax=Haptolina ericina TaxID=156174 RepID=A0A7S3C7R7_9EUKA|mmetsp:Transcript_9914/g.22531  ORF Transcript_9914/g.22531 Transcript_9914/m.22531 type:complete len:176 (+) Transcript_9914:96-623(+)
MELAMPPGGYADPAPSSRGAEKRPSNLFARGSKNPPPSVRLPMVGDESRLSRGAQSILQVGANEGVPSRPLPQGRQVRGSPECRAKRLAKLRYHPAKPHILQEDEEGRLRDQYGKPPPWSGWAEQSPTKMRGAGESADDWRGWGSQTQEDVRELALKGKAGAALDVMKTTAICHI